MKQRREPGTSQPDNDVRLFSTPDSVVAIDSPVKLQIIRLAAEGPVPFERIVEETKKAKSTISVHLRDLERSGLVTVQPDPADSRKRLIILLSAAIGSLTTADRHAKIPERVYLHEKAGEPFSDTDIVSFFRYCVRVFRTRAMVMGINLDPVLRETGLEVGRVLAPRVAGETVDDVVRRMDAFWKAHGLGAITLKGTRPITLEVHGCFECEDLPVTGHGACAFDIGVLTAIFSSHLHAPVTITEEQCFSSGDERCVFVVTIPGQ